MFRKKNEYSRGTTLKDSILRVPVFLPCVFLFDGVSMFLSFQTLEVNQCSFLQTRYFQRFLCALLFRESNFEVSFIPTCLIGL